MRILLLSKYARSGASSRHRTHEVFDGMESIDVEAAPLFDDAYVRHLYAGKGRGRLRPLGRYLSRVRRIRSGLVKRVDVVVIEKELFPWTPWLVERRFWPSRVPVVVDYDDAIYLNYRAHRGVRSKIQEVIAAAGDVVCGNPTLASYARQFASRVHVVPTTVDVKSYAVAEPVSEGRLRLGWIGTPITQKFVEDLLPVLDALARRVSLEVVLIGARPEGEIATRAYIRCVEWSPNRERTMGELFDVGIMPLPDRPFERGKCGFKLIQYGACGLPVVASPVGVNREIVVEGETGLLAREPSEWLEALERLGADRAWRGRLGAAHRVRVEERYDRHVARESWKGILSSL